VNVFKDQDVYPVTILIKKCKHTDNGTVKMTVMKSINELAYTNIVQNKIHYKDIYWDMYFFSKEISSLLLKLFSYNKIKSLPINQSGAATVGEAYKIKEFLKDDLNSNGFKLINTGTIDKYLSLWGIYRTQYLNDSYLNPYIKPSDLEKISRARLIQAQSQKIIIAGMSIGIEAFFDNNGEYLPGKSTTIILGDCILLKFILGLLNSTLISFYVNYFYHSLKMAGGYLNIGNEVIENLPIPIFDNFQLVNNHVDYCLASNDPEKIEHKMKTLDLIIYKIFDLTFDECILIDPKVEALISRMQYKKMTSKELSKYSIPQKS